MTGRLEDVRAVCTMSNIVSVGALAGVAAALLSNDQLLGAMAVTGAGILMTANIILANWSARTESAGTPIWVEDLPDGIWSVKSKEVWIGNQYAMDYASLVQNRNGGLRWVMYNKLLPTYFRINHNDLPILESLTRNEVDLTDVKAT